MQPHLETMGPMNVSFSLLDETIAELNSSSTFGTSGIRELDAFPIKTEELSPVIDKERHDTVSLGLEEDDANQDTLDILRALDLPGSLTELSELYVADEAALINTLAVDDALFGDSLVKQNKPGSASVGIGGCVGSGNGIGGINGASCSGVNMNGAELQSPHRPLLPQQQQQHQSQPLPQPQPQPQPLMTMPVIKTEKDTGYIHLVSPGVIKMENENRSYCQMSGMDLGSSHPGLSAGLGPVASQGFCYGASVPPLGVHEHASGIPQDQKPVFGLYPSRASVSDSWSRGSGFGELPGIQRPSDVLSSSPSYPMPFNR